MFHVKSFIVGILLGIIFAISTPALAKDFYVSPNGSGTDCLQSNPCSFQEALNQAANSSNDDTIYVLPGNYIINDSLSYRATSQDGNLIIQAADTNNKPILDGQNNKRILTIKKEHYNDAGQFIKISNLIFKNGKGTPLSGLGFAGGLYISTVAANITIENCTFESNTADNGAGLYISTTSGTVNINNNMFTKNKSNTGKGGALYISNKEGIIRITSNNFDNNEASNDNNAGCTYGIGGGAYILSDNANITIQDNNFTSNTSKNDGGGLFIESDATNNKTIELNNNTFTSNISEGGGGGLFVTSKTNLSRFKLKIIGNTFEGNRAKKRCENRGGGGGTYVDISGDIVAKNNTWKGNNSEASAGGVWLFSMVGTIVMQDCKLENNQTQGGAGGAFVFGFSKDITIENNTFNNNTAQSIGGGFVGGSFNGKVIFNSNILLNNNSTNEKGGGAALGSFTGSILATNNVFYNNESSKDGGGLIAGSKGDTVNIINNTIVDNTSHYGAGGGLSILLINDTAKANIYNNIIYENNAALDGNDVYVDADFEGDLLLLGNQDDNNDQGAPVYVFNNDLGPNVDAVSGQAEDLFIEAPDDIHFGSNISQDPQLVDPAQGDFHIQETSPCKNHGLNTAPELPSFDFEGDHRIRDGIVDIGADEYRPGSITLGDANGDSLINIMDALWVARCALELSGAHCDLRSADVNCDNQINIVDALLIARKAIFLPTPGWCEK